MLKENSKPEESILLQNLRTEESTNNRVMCYLLNKQIKTTQTPNPNSPSSDKMKLENLISLSP